MRKNLLKKATALLLSVLLTVTMLPTFAITALADEECFIMAYFKGDNLYGEQIRFAASTDGLNFKPLNGGVPIVREKSTDGHSYTDFNNDTYTRSDGVRDPYLFKGNDGAYYLLATDLEATEMGYWGRQPQMVAWRSENLVDWSEPTYINMAQIVREQTGAYLRNENVYRTWAPDVCYENGKYYIYFTFAAYVDGDEIKYNYNTLYYMTADDIMDTSTYSAPEQLYDATADESNPDYGSNDTSTTHGNIVEQNGTYYLFYNQEKDSEDGKLALAKADALTGPYHYVGTLATSVDTGAVEGCEIYDIEGVYHLIADRYMANGNFAFYNLGDDLSAIKAQNGDISVDDGNPIYTINATSAFSNIAPRHGSVMGVDTATYNAVTSALGGASSDDIIYNFHGYHDRTDWFYDTYYDSCGESIAIMTQNGGNSHVSKDSGFVTLNSANLFATTDSVCKMFPDDVYTVSFDFSLNNTNALDAPVFALGTGHEDSVPDPDQDYVMIFANGDIWVHPTGAATDSDEFICNAPIRVGTTYHYDIVSDNGNIIFYRDGAKIGSINTIVDFPTSGTRYASFGFSDDHATAGNGTYSRIRFRDVAVTEAKIKEEFNKKLYYTKAGGSDEVDGKSGVLNVSAKDGNNLIEPIVGETASSYSISGWVNPGETAGQNVILGIGNNSWTPAPYGRYLAVKENGDLMFNYCSGYNDGGDWSQHLLEATNIFGGALATNKWSFIQINFTPAGRNDLGYELTKVSVWVDGVQTYSQNLYVSSTEGDLNPGVTDAYNGINDFMSLGTNYMFLGNMSTPSWWQEEGDTSYVKDVRVYAQAIDAVEMYEQQKFMDNIENNDDALNDLPEFANAGLFQGNVATNGYANVVYCSSTTEFNSSKNGTNTDNYGNAKHIRYKFAIPTNIVLCYDGATTPALPIEMETKMYRSGLTNYNPGIITVYFNGTDDNGTNFGSFTNEHWWYGYLDGDWNTWAGDTVTAESYTSYTGFAKNQDHDTGAQNNNNTSRFWWNKLCYTGSFAENEYSQHFNHLTFGVYSYDSSNSASDEFIRNDDGNVYVLNYKPVYDILAGNTKVPHTDYSIADYYSNVIKGNEWMYTDDSLEQFYNAALLLTKADPNSFDYTNVSTGVDNCAKAIKNAESEFAKINLVKKQFTITYFVNGNEVTETVTAGDTLANAPSQTAVTYNGDGTHSVFSWRDGNAPSNDHMPVSDEYYFEDEAVSNCDKDVSSHTDAVGDTNGYTDYACSVCGNINEADRVWDETTQEWADYNEQTQEIPVHYADGQYTTSSRETYKDTCDAITSAVNEGDESKSPEFIEAQTQALADAENKLNPVADFDALDATVEANADTMATNNADSNGNIYTYDSWVAFAEAYNGGNGYHEKTDAERADTPMYAVDANGNVTSELSDEQTSINIYNDGIANAAAALQVVDSNESFETYETAKTVVESSLDSRKYTQEGLDYINGAISDADNAVYKTLTAEEAARYNECTGTALSEGDKLRNAGAGETDTQTEAVLSAATTLNSDENKAQYIKQYSVDFSVQNDEGDTLYTDNTMQYYGESVDLAVPEDTLAGNTVARWSTTNFGDDGVTVEGSMKASGSVGSTYTKIVSGNMSVVAELEQNAKQLDDGYVRYDVCDVYGSVVDIIYNAETPDYSAQTVTFTSPTASVTARNIPMYSFESWELNQVSDTQYRLVPVYSAKPTYNFTFIGASEVNGNTDETTGLSNVDYDSLITITSDLDNFAAWAVVTPAGKIQIASYNPICTFYACADENYVAICADTEGGFSTCTGQKVTASVIDGIVADGITDADALNAIVNDKLANKKAFISVQNVKMTSTQARVYARITQGAANGSGYGVLYRKGDATDAQMKFGVDGTSSRNITSALKTGQFAYTLNSASTIDFDITFRCYVDYNTNYNSTSINSVDYSAVAIAQA